MCGCGLPLHSRRVPPQIFKAVKGALFLVKNVNNHLQEVEHHPLAGGKSINRHGSHRMVLSQSRFDFVGDRFQLRLRRAGADHKKIRKRRDTAQIQHDDVFRLFVRGEFRAGCC
jgi:hypothetical protein